MHDIVARLTEALPGRVSTERADLEVARADRSGHVSDSAPLAVVTATSVDDVQRVMRLATATRTPVVVRGAGTGLAGGAIAGEGEIVLSLAAMDRILEISRDDELAVVEPGVITQRLNDALAEHGLFWAPDPASKEISTVGGNIATNAGGLLCAKYGVTREAVLGLTVVRADGEVLELGRRTVKGVAGLDLTALMIGSEGTLGVVVGATLALRPIPRGGIATIAAYFDSVEAAARASAVITASGLRPAIMELLDAQAVGYIARHLALSLRPSAQLLVSFDGAGAEDEADAALTIVRSLGGDAELTRDRAQSEELFRVRRAFHPALAASGTVLIEDVCVPRSALPAMFSRVAEIEAEFGIRIPTVAHAGDGNMHPNFVFEPDPAAPGGVPARVWEAADALFVSALRFGGTLTGEHGVGLLKRRWLGDELGGTQLEVQRAIKAVFDPLGILGAGKVF